MHQDTCQEHGSILVILSKWYRRLAGALFENGAPAARKMRIVGNRNIRPLSFHGSSDLLTEGARFNDELQQLPGGNCARVRKGVYCFKTHEAANSHDSECIANGMAKLALERRT